MAKKKKSSNTVSFTPSTLKIGDRTLAKTYRDRSGQIINELMETPEQKSARENYEKLLKKYLPQVDSFSPDYIASRDSQLKAVQDRGKKMINDMYAPMVEKLKNDIISRFGTLNSSSFLQNLNKIEDHREDAVEDLVENLLAKRDELDDKQTARNYNFLNLLQNGATTGIKSLYDALNMSSNFAGFGPSRQEEDEEDDKSYLPFYLRWL